MAAKAPDCIDNQDIQFKLHDKLQIYHRDRRNLISYVNLLSVASTKGLLFAANHHVKEFLVFKLKDLVDCKDLSPNHDVGVRIVAISGNPYVLACSCDGTMLAVNYTFNDLGYVEIYSIDSFLTQNIMILYNIQISPQSNVFTLQILWNPVMTNNLAVVLTSGWASVYNLAANGQYNQVSLSADNQVKCGCWSPKGKQIVFGLDGGKLQQYKPTLAPARIIPCPPGIHEGVFDVIAIQWLSTYQFAVALLTRGEDKCPSIYIVNAPKAVAASFINYYDVCYSGCGPRNQQINFHHIQPWNLLCISSANGVEIAVLGTKESGEHPIWYQYALLDDARIELPLTDEKEETYPMGLALNTAYGYKLFMGEVQMPEMPLMYILSSNGNLISYVALNLTANAVNICSPIPPLDDKSGQFKWLKQDLNIGKELVTVTETPVPTTDITFTINSNLITSTPALKEKPAAVFNIGNNVQMNNLPNSGTIMLPSPAAADTTTPSPTSTLFSENQGNRYNGIVAITTTTAFAAAAVVNEATTPLYTIPPTYVPPPQCNADEKELTNKPLEDLLALDTKSDSSSGGNTEIYDDIIKEMIAVKIAGMDEELQQLRQQSHNIVSKLGNIDEIKSYTKQLNELHEIVDQANDPDFEQDVRNLRHSMNDSYTMLIECRSKFDLYSNPDLIRMTVTVNSNPANRRQLMKLQSLVTRNANQLQHLENLVELQWSEYQDIVRRNSKHHLHIPCLDGIYQKMSKLKDLLAKQRLQIAYIKSKLKQKGLNYKPPNTNDLQPAIVIESLTDSILSLSLSETVTKTQSKLSSEKLNAIRMFTRQQQTVNVIKPRRPDRIGLKSEVILECKLHSERLKQKEKTASSTELAGVQKSSIKPDQSTTSVSPAATPLTNASYQSKESTFIKPTFKAFGDMAAFPTKTTSPSTGVWNFNPNKVFTFSSDSSTFNSQTTQASSKASEPQTIEIDSKNSYSAATNSGKSIIPPVICNVKTIPTTTKPAPAATSSTMFAGLSNSKAATLSTQQSVLKSNNSVFKLGDLLSNTDANPIANLPKATTVSIKFTEEATATQNKPVFPGANNEITLVPVTSATSNPQTTTSTTGSFSFANFNLNSSNIFSTKTAATTTTATTPAAAVAVATATTTPAVTAIKDNNSANASLPPTNFTSVSASASASAATATSIAISTTSATPTITSSGTGGAECTDAIFGSLKICSPSTNRDAGDTSKSEGIFSSVLGTATTSPLAFSFGSAGGAGDGAKNFFANSSNTNATTASSFEKFSAAMSQPATTIVAGSNAFSFSSVSLPAPVLTAAAETSGATAASPTSTTNTSFPSLTLNLNTSPTIATNITQAAATKAIPVTSNIATSSANVSIANASSGNFFNATTAAPLFASPAPNSSVAGTSIFNIPPPSTISMASGNPFSATAKTDQSLFNNNTSITITPVVSTNAPVFATLKPATAPAANVNIFSSVTKANQPSVTSGGGGGFFTPVASSANGSIFNTASTNAFSTNNSSSSLFANAASTFTSSPSTDGNFFTANKPAESGGNLFAAAAAAAAANKPAEASGSIFGGTKQPENAGNIFAAVRTNESSGGNIFASAAKQVENNSTIFGTTTEQSVSSGGSIFGKSTFGQTSEQSTANPFSINTNQANKSNIFNTSGNALFGSSGNNTSQNSSLFATSNLTFGSPNNSGGAVAFGAFSQPSTAPPFGSPTGTFGQTSTFNLQQPQQQQQQTSSNLFTPPSFGSPPPTFGAQPTFGGAPTFGSGKGFGTFASNTSTFGTSSSAAAKGNIFETLGSSNTGLSFGNLADSSNQQSVQPKPAFGGSSFMNYRS